MKRDKKIKKIANELAKLEQDMMAGKNAESCEIKMQELAKSLSLEDMVAIDNYIVSHQLVK